METSSNIGVNIRQNSEAWQIDNRPKYFPPTEDQAAAAEILLQHDDRVKVIIQDLAGLPKEVVDQVLIEIVNQPSENPQAVRNQALLAALGRPDMNWSKEFDLIVRKCRDAKAEDVKEFFRVFPVLSRRMTPIEVFRKLITEKISQLYVVSVEGKEVPVTQHGTFSYTLQSHIGQKFFESLDEVYEYLGTPGNKRR